MTTKLSEKERDLVELCRGALHNDDWNGHFVTDLVVIIDRLTAPSEPEAWQWRYVGEAKWKTPSGGEKITADQLKRERPIEQRPLFAMP